ncbi:MAG TPA: GreA/GreB family elongation factor [Polyangiaceae bacterium]|nr:GreA/GreB family elongation factor [Polyangiaceae bacterium]
MNKAFTKEDETSAPPMVPARAPLPAGTPNYVTARGLEKLKTELRELDGERARLALLAAGVDRAQALAHLAARKSALEERLAGATLVDATKQPRDEVRFGANVDVRTASGASRTYRIVGVDEAEPAAGLVAFISPIARALLGRSAGESVSVRTPRGEEELEIVGIAYGEPADARTS